jgi:hypothetical protein
VPVHLFPLGRTFGAPLAKKRGRKMRENRVPMARGCSHTTTARN